MKQAGKNPDGSNRGAMAAGIGTREAIEALVDRAREADVLAAVNFNSPGQTVVAGDSAAVARFIAITKEDRASGVKALPLSVSGAFHSALMHPAAEGLSKTLASVEFRKPSLPVFLNVTGKALETDATKSSALQDFSEYMRDILVSQIQSPVQWIRTVESMVALGVNTIVEVGPGRTLSGLVKKIAPKVRTMNVEDAETLKATVAALSE